MSFGLFYSHQIFRFSLRQVPFTAPWLNSSRGHRLQRSCMGPRLCQWPKGRPLRFFGARIFKVEDIPNGSSLVSFSKSVLFWDWTRTHEKKSSSQHLSTENLDKKPSKRKRHKLSTCIGPLGWYGCEASGVGIQTRGRTSEALGPPTAEIDLGILRLQRPWGAYPASYPSCSSAV